MKKLDLSTMKAANFSPTERPSAEKRTVNFRVLVVSEGTKTEKNYFEAFPKFKYHSCAVDVDCKGTATNTLWVVKEAERLEAEARCSNKPYDMVWVVFDRDSFEPTNFDNAINKARVKGYGCAWSNEAFELWYVLHFEDRQTAMSRADYTKCITNHVRKHLKGYTYKKNDPSTYDILERYGNQSAAIRRAEKMIAYLSGTAPNKCNPATTVYQLVRILTGQDKRFNERLAARMTAGAGEEERMN